MGLTSGRPPLEVFQANRLLKQMAASGMELFPLGVRSKMPRDKGFLLHDYVMSWAKWMARFGNVGVRARAIDLIMDVDPKNGGLASFAALQWDCDDDFTRYARTDTGRQNGGFHLFMSKPADLGLKWHHKRYPGIDFQTLGRYVVAPGSIHPDTGKAYTMAAWHDPIPEAPAGLLALLAKPPRVARSDMPSGMLTTDEVAGLLDKLDPLDFGTGGQHHDEWLDIAMACHEGTNGDDEALAHWLDWCARDPQYGDEARENNAYRWDSFDAARGQSSGPDAVTYKTLLHAVSRAGFKSYVASLRHGVTAKEDFAEDDEDVDALEALVAADHL